MGAIHSLFLVGVAHTFTQLWAARVFIIQVQAGQQKASIAEHHVSKMGYQLLTTIIEGGLMGTLAKHWQPKHPHRPTHTNTLWPEAYAASMSAECTQEVMRYLRGSRWSTRQTRTHVDLLNGVQVEVEVEADNLAWRNNKTPPHPFTAPPPHAPVLPLPRLLRKPSMSFYDESPTLVAKLHF